jgi:hypothetical protein
VITFASTLFSFSHSGIAVASASVRNPGGGGGRKEFSGGRRMGGPLIGGPIPSTAAGATHAEFG